MLGIAVIVAAAFYRPLIFWAANAWDLRQPIEALLVGLVFASIGVLFYGLGRRLTRHELPIAIPIGLMLFLLLHWRRTSSVDPRLIVALILLASVLVSRLGVGIQRGLAAMMVLFLGLGSIGQLVVGHIRDSAEIPIVTQTPRSPAEATGLVEDVLVVVVDSYPSLAVAERLFGHDISVLRSSLTGMGYQVHDLGWSQHTYTSFAIPALMELTPVVRPGSGESWGNSRNLYDIIGGDNLFADTLRSAGFEYTHVESGLNAGACYDVDVCVDSGWLNETTWQLLAPTFLGGWLKSLHKAWMVPATLSTHDHLLTLDGIFDDGEVDYVFAHLILPHAPFVVDEQCQPASENPRREEYASIRAQFACADRLLTKIASIPSNRTAVVISGDHGAKSRLSFSMPPDEWTEQDIIEAFGVLLAYRLPEGCQSPTSSINTEVMRAVFTCAVDVEPPANSGELLIGLEKHRWVAQAEIRSIEMKLENGELTFVEDEVLGASYP